MGATPGRPREEAGSEGGGSTIVMSSTGDGVEDGGLHPGCSRGGGMLWAGVKDGRERHWCLGHKDGERWKREHGA
jgi:hypothetical protein